MNRLILEGIVKKNTRGRAYLVYFTWQGARAILRLCGNLENAENGETVTIIGRPQGVAFQVERVIPRRFPRRKLRNSGVA